MTDHRTRPPEETPRTSLDRLRRQNVVVGSLHLLQAVAVLVLTNDLAFPVTAAFLQGDPVAQRGPQPVEQLFEVPVGPVIAVFLLLAAIDHLLMAVPPLRGWYERNLAYGRNYARWIEYSVSASLMLVLIAMLAGIWDLSGLIGLFGLNTAMILFGLLQEKDHQPGGDMHAFWFGTLAGLMAWATIGVYLLAGATPPTFVFAIFVSLFVFFMTFGVNQYLQYARVGPWVDYVHGERVYLWLSLVAKSALAWQVFANVLRA